MKETVAMPIPRLSLAALSLMASLPFLVPLHTTPIPSFHAEWLAALLGLAASIALVGARRLPLPGVTMLALACAAVAALQMALGRAPVPQLTTLFIVYLLWAALLGCTASHLAETLGRPRLARALAGAILAGALLAAVLGLAQPWLAALGWPGFPVQSGGPLGQVNHLSIYLWLGLASALYLRTTAGLSRPAFWAAVGGLTLTAAMVGQRSSLLYAAALIGVAVWQTRRLGDAGQPDARRLALGIGLLFVLWQPATILLPAPAESAARPPPALRAVQAFDGPSIRLQLMRTGASGILAAPLLGNGVGSYPGLAIAHADKIAPADNPGPSEHAHNLFVDLGAELGLPAAVLVVLAMAGWLRRLPQRAPPAEATWAAAVLVMLGLHSMVEYPLWHTFFLGLLAVVAGGFGSGRSVGGRLAPVALTLGVLVWGSVTLAELRRDYVRIELALAIGKQPANQPLGSALLLSVPRTSLLAPWVQTTACVSLDPLSVESGDGLAVCRAAMAFAPTAETATNLAVLLWRTAEAAQGRDLLRRIRRASSYYAHGRDDLLAPLIAREMGLAEIRGPK